MQRLVLYGMFASGLLLAGMSFLVCLGNALAGEGRKEGIEQAAFIGVMAGAAISGGGIFLGAARSGRVLPLAAVIMGGTAAAIGGWSLWSLNGGTSILEWMLAGCFAPIGMWLGWLGGGSRSRVVAGAAAGGAVGAVLLGAVAMLLFGILGEGPGDQLHTAFNLLSGLFVGGVLGTALGAFIGFRQPTVAAPQ